MYPEEPPASQPERPPKMTDGKNVELVHASMQRMGTQSIAEAYSILGFKPHHYFNATDSNWDQFERAVDGKWPQIPGAKPGRKLYTRADWDMARGDYDLFTDWYSHHTPDIIRAYPEAKVVVVQREFDSWWKSYKYFCLDPFSATIWLPMRWLLRVAGIVNGDVTERERLGFFEVKNINDITTELARKKYDEFFAEVRALVPKERRLEYKLGQGWEPLCEFLGKPVPDVPFPHMNKMDEHARKKNMMLGSVYMIMAAVAVGVGSSAWYVLR